MTMDGLISLTKIAFVFVVRVNILDRERRCRNTMHKQQNRPNKRIWNYFKKR